MNRTVKIIATDARIDAALGRARRFAPYDQSVTRAAYDSKNDQVCLRLANGVMISIPRKYLQGLDKARSSQLMKIELLGGGTGLHWPRLDVSHYVPGLLSYVFGTKQWMAELGRLGGVSRSDAKKAAARVNGLKGGRPAKKKISSTVPGSRKQATGKINHRWSQIERRKKTA